MSNISHPSLTLSNINKKKQIQYKQAYLISSFSSKFFQSLENNLEKEKKEIKENDTNDKISSITKPKTKLKSLIKQYAKIISFFYFSFLKKNKKN